MPYPFVVQSAWIDIDRVNYGICAFAATVAATIESGIHVICQALLKWIFIEAATTQ